MDVSLKFATNCLERLYEFEAALQADNNAHMNTIYKEIVEEAEQAYDDTNEQFILEYLQQQLWAVLFMHKVGETAEVNTKDIHDHLCLRFESFTLAGLMLEGMPLEDARVSAGLGLRPTFKAASPF